jgi:hypothetical protein
LRMREAVLGAIAAAPDGSECVLISHQLPIWMARLAFEKRFPGPHAPLQVRAFPWLFLRERCGHASITTLTIQSGQLIRVSYWEPPAS